MRRVLHHMYNARMRNIILHVVHRASHETHEQHTFASFQQLIDHLTHDRDDASNECFVRSIDMYALRDTSIIRFVVVFASHDRDICDYVIDVRRNMNTRALNEQLHALYANNMHDTKRALCDDLHEYASRHAYTQREQLNTFVVDDDDDKITMIIER